MAGLNSAKLVRQSRNAIREASAILRERMDAALAGIDLVGAAQSFADRTASAFKAALGAAFDDLKAWVGQKWSSIWSSLSLPALVQRFMPDIQLGVVPSAPAGAAPTGSDTALRNLYGINSAPAVQSFKDQGLQNNNSAVVERLGQIESAMREGGVVATLDGEAAVRVTVKSEGGARVTGSAVSSGDVAATLDVGSTDIVGPQ